MYQRRLRKWRSCFNLWWINIMHQWKEKKSGNNGQNKLFLICWPIQQEWCLSSVWSGAVTQTNCFWHWWVTTNMRAGLVTEESTLLFRYKKNLEVPKFLSFPHKTCPLTPFMGQTSTRVRLYGGEKRHTDDRSFIALLSIFGKIEESRFHMFSCLGCFEHREK